ncbi:putative LRR receptor-like serine/threonine-protein kinase [Cinnamomum micranthum f. kanehirae]|uniref:non-specific serine/threonine protein kinase n=1 Tax=Cinnamomum micranthum f. kanehirae TaxID=337451 RepID=A0A443NI04_9MAGN|nr:putative LRR receptor-like serine/threonine-protein kinase [Cinnamomum micranthum f. kanehirae]
MALAWFSILVSSLALAVSVQGQPGFISIDCGRAEDSIYTDSNTGIAYVPDAKFIQTGVNKEVAINSEGLPPIYRNLRIFPNGGRNCYDLRDVTKGNKYLIRAYFMYGNYDGKNSAPKFDLYIGVNLWGTIFLFEATIVLYAEIMTVATMNYISICLVDTSSGTPFISALELRPLNNSMYGAVNENQSVLSKFQIDLGGFFDNGEIRYPLYRYPTEPLDLFWTYEDRDYWRAFNTSKIVTNKNGALEPSSTVMMTAVRPVNNSDALYYSWLAYDSSAQYHVYLHFAELELLGHDMMREFTVCCGDSCYGEPVRPEYLVTTTIQIPQPLSGQGDYSCSIEKTLNSTLPPILNALEIFTILQLTEKPTRELEVEAMFDIKETYKVMRNWMGDPCVPVTYVWEGLTCNVNLSDSPTIVYLNLSSTGLKGEIAASLANLTSIQSLDLSWNNLTGHIPNFLGDLPSLSSLKLSGNQLSGSVPSNLLEKSKKGSLKLSVDGNPDLCVSDSCGKDSNKRKITVFIVPLVASVVTLLILLIILWRFKRRKQDPVVKANKKGGLVCSEYRWFTYAEVINMTNNFERAIGKGGFGTVYHGQLPDGTEVAVKILSPLSAKLISHTCQGSNEFQNEVQLLMRVHHRNLVSFIGYCQEGDTTALIYEYMAQGNLYSHLLGTNSNSKALNWGERLRIALNVAQGLEYLHNGCKPAIIHRDIKTTHILLNERLEAKIGDFGFTKAFFKDDKQTQVSTVVKGTPGYLDPECFHSNNLTQKSDVYSFGVVLLELITGQPAISRSKRNLVDWASPRIATRDIQAIVDPRLEGNYDVNTLFKAGEIALACTSPRSIDRPTMTDVVAKLKDCLGTETVAEITCSLEMEQVESTSMPRFSSQPLLRKGNPPVSSSEIYCQIPIFSESFPKNDDVVKMIVDLVCHLQSLELRKYGWRLNLFHALCSLVISLNSNPTPSKTPDGWKDGVAMFFDKLVYVCLVEEEMELDKKRPSYFNCSL